MEDAVEIPAEEGYQSSPSRDNIIARGDANLDNKQTPLGQSPGGHNVEFAWSLGTSSKESDIAQHGSKYSLDDTCDSVHHMNFKPVNMFYASKSGPKQLPSQKVIQASKMQTCSSYTNHYGMNENLMRHMYQQTTQSASTPGPTLPNKVTRQRSMAEDNPGIENTQSSVETDEQEEEGGGGLHSVRNVTSPWDERGGHSDISTTQVEDQHISGSPFANSPSVDSTGQRATPALTSQSPNGAGMHRPISSNLPQLVTHSVLAPQNAKHRVVKAQRASVASRADASNSQAVPGQMPTEEDLMLLLMRSRRQQTEIHKDLDARYRQLEAYTVQLEDENTAKNKDIQAIRQRWHITVQENHAQQAQLRGFKDKYLRLKQAVEETTHIHVSLGEEQQRFRDEFSSMKAYSCDIVEDNRALLGTCESATMQISQIKSGVSQLRLEVVRCGSVQKELAWEQARVREEKLQNKTYALYIQRLEGSQRSTQMEFSKRQAEIVAELTKMSSAIKRQDDTAATDIVGLLAEVLDGIRDLQHSKPTDGEKVQERLAIAEQRHESLKDTLEGVQNAQHDRLTSADLKLSSLMSAVDKLKPSLEDLQVLRRQNDDLVAKVKQGEESLKGLQREKSSTQTFTIGLLEARKQVLGKNLVANSQPQRKIMALNDQIHQQNILLLSKGTEISEICGLMKKLEQTVMNLNKELADIQTEHEANVNQLSTTHKSELEQREKEARVQLASQTTEITRKNEELRQVQSELDQLKVQALEAEENHQKQKDHDRKLTDDLLAQTQQISKLEAEKEKLRDEISDVTQKLRDMEQLPHELHETRLLVEEHRMRAAELDQTKKRLENEQRKLASQLIEKEWHIGELGTQKSELQIQLNSANQRLSSMTQLQIENTELGSQIAGFEQRIQEQKQTLKQLVNLRQMQADSVKEQERLSQELGKAEQEARRVKELTEATNKQAETINILQASERATSGRVQELEDALNTAENRNEELSQQVQQFHSELEARSAECAQLQQANKAKVGTIHDQHEQISALGETAAQLEDTQKSLKSKEACVADLDDRVKVLEADARKFDLFRTYITDEEIDQFDESIVLSIKSIIDQSLTQRSKVDPGQAAQRLDEDNFDFVPETQIQGIGLNELNTADTSLSPDFLDDHIGSSFDLNEHLQILDQQEFSAPQNQSRLASYVRPGTANDEMLLRSAVAFKPSEFRAFRGTKSPGVEHCRRTEPDEDSWRLTDLARLCDLSNRDAPSQESPAPNSAAKRQRAPDVAAEREKAPKRPRQPVNLKNLEVRASSRMTLTPKAIRLAENDTIHDIQSSTSIGASTIGTSAPAPGKARKKTDTIKKTSKENQYGARFSGNA